MRRYIIALLATTTSLLHIQLHRLHLVEAHVKIEALLPLLLRSALVWRVTVPVSGNESVRGQARVTALDAAPADTVDSGQGRQRNRVIRCTQKCGCRIRINTYRSNTVNCTPSTLLEFFSLFALNLKLAVSAIYYHF